MEKNLSYRKNRKLDFLEFVVHLRAGSGGRGGGRGGFEDLKCGLKRARKKLFDDG